MFGSRRNQVLEPSAYTKPHPRSDFELILTKFEFQPGQLITFEVNARNGNAVRLNLYTQLMQTTVLFRRGKFSAEKVEIASVMSRSTFCNMMWRDQIRIPPGTPPTKALQPNHSVSSAVGIPTVAEIRYSLILSTRVESVKLIRDEVEIRIVSPETFTNPCSDRVESFGNQNYQPSAPPPMMETLIPESFLSGRDLPRSLLDNPPPRYSLLSLVHSSLHGSVETLPPSYEDATQE